MDDKLSLKLDSLDAKIVALFEKRMELAEKAVSTMTKHDLRCSVRQVKVQAVEKATNYACDVSTIAYTEELIKLMLCASCKYQRRIMKRKKNN